MVGWFYELILTSKPIHVIFTDSYITLSIYIFILIYDHHFLLSGTSSRDSLLSWIRLLERNGNAVLEKIPVIFTLIAPPNEIAIHETLPADNEKGKKENMQANTT